MNLRYEKIEARASQQDPLAFVAGYGLALAATALAALARWTLPWALTPAPYLGFYPAVVASAALGGVGPGLVATFSSLLLVNFVFGRFDIHDQGAMMRQVIWVIASIGVSLLAGMQRAARIRERRQAEELRHLNDELEVRVQERTSEIRKANETLELQVAERTVELRAANTNLDDSRRAAINLLEDALDARRQAEQAAAELRESEEKLALALRSAGMGVWRLDLGEQKRHFDDQVCHYLGIDPEQFGGTAEEFYAAVHPADREGLSAALNRTIGSGAPYEAEYRAVWPDGRVHHINARGQLTRDAAGQPQRVDGLAWDITERKQAEERLQASLREKEVMLKEIHHRVKNNLQVISSLVGLQAEGSGDASVREVLRDVTFRVRSMALVHEKLYQSPDLARIDFAEYAKSLLNYLWHAYGSNAAAVRLTFDLEPLPLPVDTAVPCGLILNELAGNALKHAFQGRDSGEVIVSLQGTADGCISLCLRDNGVGLPKGLDWQQAPSLGLRLVQMLAGQLNATVEVSCAEGTKFEITFMPPEVTPPGLHSAGNGKRRETTA